MTEPNTQPRPPSMLPAQSLNPITRIRAGLTVTVIGLLVFILGADPGIFGLDRSPVTGFVQIVVFLAGLGLISTGGFMALKARWKDAELPIRAEIGARLISTGYVVAVASGMADIFGFGSESFPRIPDFGIWQQRGVLVGEILIGIGFVLVFRFGRKERLEGPGK